MHRLATTAPTATDTGGQAGFTWAQLGRLGVATLARTLIASVVTLGAWGALPVLLGWHPTTVMTGSMEPRLMVGDLAVSKPVAPQDLALDRVVLFDDPDHPGRLRLHRLIEFDTDGRLVTKGDANPQSDSTHVDPATVRGVGMLRVPYVGLPIVWLKEGAAAPVGVVVAGLVALLALSGLDRDLVRTRPSAHVVAPPSRTRVATAVSLAVAALVAAPIVLGSPGAYAAFTAKGVNPTSNLSAATYYRCSGAVTADGPSLFYRLDETPAVDATATDSSSAARNGSYPNGATSTASACASDGSTGRAATFNGTTQYVASRSSAAAITAPDTFTLETWFKTSVNQGKLIGFGNARTGASSSYDRHLFVNTSGQLVFGVYSGGVKTLTSSAVVADGSWHHAVATLSPNGMKLYLDGVRVAFDAASTTAEPNTGWWRVGYDSLANWGAGTPASGYFNGSLDNVAVYPFALTATQVSAHYAARS